MGTMGGGVGFLNKKTWHPGSLRNMEKVNIRESESLLRNRKVYPKHFLKERDTTLQQHHLSVKDETPCPSYVSNMSDSIAEYSLNQLNFKKKLKTLPHEQKHEEW